VAEISQTGDQMLTVLETVASSGPIGAADLARACDMNRTVAHRLLNTLTQRNYIRRERSGYVLGSAAIKLGNSAELDIASLAKPLMDKLAEQTSETVVLHCIDKDEAVVVEQSIGAKHLVRVQHTPGSRHPLNIGASGWSILAFQDKRIINRALKRVPDEDAARERIAKIQLDGYAISHDELQQGVHGIAAPLLDAHGACSASIAILVPSGRSGSIAKLADALLATAKSISQDL
jgi:DNA-binding IclR family transcriptional regulator